MSHLGPRPKLKNIKPGGEQHDVHSNMNNREPSRQVCCVSPTLEKSGVRHTQCISRVGVVISTTGSTLNCSDFSEVSRRRKKPLYQNHLQEGTAIKLRFTPDRQPQIAPLLADLCVHVFDLSNSHYYIADKHCLMPRAGAVKGGRDRIETSGGQASLSRCIRAWRRKSRWRKREHHCSGHARD